MSKTTSFTLVYDRFLSKITDDMFMELNEIDTCHLLSSLLLSAISCFEFPRVDLFDYELMEASETVEYCGVASNNIKVQALTYEGGYFYADLSAEEIEILATYMIVEWIGQQLASVENTRMKYSGSDFKFTSQASHLKALLSLKETYKTEGFHLQRLYKRRKKDANGIYRSAFDEIMADS